MGNKQIFIWNIFIIIIELEFHYFSHHITDEKINCHFCKFHVLNNLFGTVGFDGISIQFRFNWDSVSWSGLIESQMEREWLFMAFSTRICIKKKISHWKILLHNICSTKFRCIAIWLPHEDSRKSQNSCQTWTEHSKLEFSSGEVS